ncbi:MAG: hypothetical protein IPK78_14415 [Rhodospirillales bacterium]|nr:hypothetical protein [Rhodospirillales bacterium]
MSDLTKSWVRFRDLPDDILDDMPEHVRQLFLAARRGGFEVEMLCAGASPPAARRASRRFVLIADDLGDPDRGGPLIFDLAALTRDVRAANRLFVISTQPRAELYAAAYAAAVEDLNCGFNVAMVVETRLQFAKAWARTLAALRDGASLTAAGRPDDLKSPLPLTSRRKPRRHKRAC